MARIVVHDVLSGTSAGPRCSDDRWHLGFEPVDLLPVMPTAPLPSKPALVRHQPAELKRHWVSSYHS